MKEIKFPQFRKYQNGKSYFKILSIDQFEELKMIPGKGFERHEFQAKILPDRNFIQDMLFDYAKFWTKIKAEEYQMIQSQRSE